MIKAVNPYLNFPGNTEEACAFYRSVLGGELVGPVRFRDFPLELASATEAERVFDGLSAAGTVEMALTRTEWAEKFGTCRDRFGVQWMVSYTGSVVFGT